MEDWKYLLTGIRTFFEKAVLKITGKVDVDFPEVQKVEISNPQEPLEAVAVSNLIDYSEKLQKVIDILSVPEKEDDYSPIIKALKELKTSVEVEAPDFTPVVTSLSEVLTAVRDLKQKYPEFDVSPIVTAIGQIPSFNLEKHLYKGEFPVILNTEQFKKILKSLEKQVSGAVVSLAGGGGSTGGVVTATDLDIRDIDHATDDIAVFGRAKGSTAAAAPTVSTAGANNNCLDVMIHDTAGNEMDFFKQNDSFTAGTDHGLMILGVGDDTPQRYYPLKMETTNNDNEAVSVTPTALEVSSHNMMFDGTAWDRVRGTSTDGMLVNLGTNNDVTVTNATAANLNCTEASAAAIKTAVETMDDWDDADRAKISSRLIQSAIDDTTVTSTIADCLIFDSSGDTDAVELTITNCHTTAMYVCEDTSGSVTDFMYYIPPKQTIVINHAGNTGTTQDLYGVRDTGNSGLCKVYSRKYK